MLYTATESGNLTGIRSITAPGEKDCDALIERVSGSGWARLRDTMLRRGRSMKTSFMFGYRVSYDGKKLATCWTFRCGTDLVRCVIGGIWKRG